MIVKFLVIGSNIDKKGNNLWWLFYIIFPTVENKLCNEALIMEYQRQIIKRKNKQTKRCIGNINSQLDKNKSIGWENKKLTT